MKIRSAISAFLVVLLVSSLVLCGCGEDNTAQKSTTAVVTTTEPATEPDIALDENDIFSAIGDYDFSLGIDALKDITIDLDKIPDAQKDLIFNTLRTYLLKIGFDDAIFKIVDIADTEGSEIIGLLKMDGNWSLYVIRFESGSPVQLQHRKLTDENTAYYLVTHEEKLYMLEYTQSVYTSDDGEVHYDYAYKLYRFGSGDMLSIELEDSLSYTNAEELATEAAEFFKILNNYLNFEIVVLYDPFVLTGDQWIDDTEIDQGERPEQTIDTEEGVEEQTRIGFVEVDIDSWLNFRVGAGVHNDKVLVDPSNPESFIKLAKGTPVTILEEVSISDAENPLWYKIQVNYGDKTLTGYSSATYIRTEND